MDEFNEKLHYPRKLHVWQYFNSTRTIVKCWRCSSFSYQNFRQFWAWGVPRSFYRKLKSSSPTKLLSILPTTTKPTKTSSNKVTKYVNNSLDHTPVFWFTKIPLENVAVTLKNLKVSKSTGPDKIPAEVLKKNCFKCNCTIVNIHI